MSWRRVSDASRQFWVVVLVLLALVFGGIAFYVDGRRPQYEFDEFFPPDEEVLQ